MRKTILITIIFIGLIALINLIAEILSNIITMDMIIKCIYLVLGVSIIYLFKEVR